MGPITRSSLPLHMKLKKFGQNINPSRTFPPTLSEIDYLKILLHKRVIHHCRCQTVHNARWKVLQDVAEWLQISESFDLFYDEIERDRLITILSKDTKRKHVQLIPLDESDWTRLLKQWLNQNMIEKDVKERTVYALLAVDGFHGFESQDLKFYLPNMIDVACVRRIYRSHSRAVRNMYYWIDNHPDLCSLTGTDSGCVIFLALLRLYAKEMKNIMMDDKFVMQTNRIKLWAEGFLYRNAKYYDDVRKVTDQVLDDLGKVYVSYNKDWCQVAEENLKLLLNWKK